MSMYNPGLPSFTPQCGADCGEDMRSFDQLPRSLRDFFNTEACARWCMCNALRRARLNGAEATLLHYRRLEAEALAKNASLPPP